MRHEVVLAFEQGRHFGHGAARPQHLAVTQVAQLDAGAGARALHVEAPAQQVGRAQQRLQARQVERGVAQRGGGHAREHAQPRVARQCRDDVVSHGIAQGVVLSIGGQAAEGHDRQRGAQVGCQRRRCCAAGGVAPGRAQDEGAHRLVDMLEVARTEVLDVGMHLVRERAAQHLGRHCLPGLRQAGQPRAKVDT